MFAGAPMFAGAAMSTCATRTDRPSLAAPATSASASAGEGSIASTRRPSRARGRLFRPVPAPTSRTRAPAGSACAAATTRASGSAPKSGGSRVATQCSYCSASDDVDAAMP